MASTIHYQQLYSGFRLNNKRAISSWIRACIQEEGFVPGDISIVFCTDDYLLDINKEYLQHNYYTDIISFDYTENQLVSGDLLISLDRVKENAIDLKVSFDEELNRVIIHGVLHLCGFKDKRVADQKKMRSREDYYLKKRKF